MPIPWRFDDLSVGNLSLDSASKGILIVSTGTPPLSLLAPGTSGQVLTIDAAQSVGMKWAASGGGGGGGGGGTVTGIANAGEVAYWDTPVSITGCSNFLWGATSLVLSFPSGVFQEYRNVSYLTTDANFSALSAYEIIDPPGIYAGLIPFPNQTDTGQFYFWTGSTPSGTDGAAFTLHGGSDGTYSTAAGGDVVLSGGNVNYALDSTSGGIVSILGGVVSGVTSSQGTGGEITLTAGGSAGGDGGGISLTAGSNAYSTGNSFTGGDLVLTCGSGYEAGGNFILTTGAGGGASNSIAGYAYINLSDGSVQAGDFGVFQDSEQIIWARRNHDGTSTSMLELGATSSGRQLNLKGSEVNFVGNLFDFQQTGSTPMVAASAHARFSLDPASKFSMSVAGSPYVPFGGYQLCNIVVGAGASPLLNAELGPHVGNCFVPHGGTIREITVVADAGAPSVQLRKRHGTTLTNLLSGALATASGGLLACSRAGGAPGNLGFDGITTCTQTLSTTSIAAGDWIELTSGTAGGTAKRMSIGVTYTVP